MPKQANIDRLATELYDACRLCVHCRQAVTLADQLGGCCPHCGGALLAGPDTTPERARDMLAELQARRLALGKGARL